MSELKVVDGKLEYVNESGQVCSIDGELVADTKLNPDYPLAKLFQEFFNTDLGDDFFETFGLETINPTTGLTNSKVVERIFTKLYAHDPRITMSRITDCVRTAIDAGALTPKPEEIAVTPPRDDRGRFADEHALLRQEVRKMLDDPQIPASALRARASTDAKFRAAMETEMSPAIPSRSEAPPDAEELRTFAKHWRNAKSVHPIAGIVTIGEGGYTVQQLNELLQRASAAGVL